MKVFENKKYNTAIFDLDGVIVDTAKYHFLAWKRLANELGFDFTQKDNERLKGVSRMRSLEILLEIGGLGFDHDTKMRLCEKKNKWYVDMIRKLTPDETLPGVVSFMKSLKNKQVKIALASASKNAQAILNNLELEDYFDAVIDGTIVSKGKPDPEVFTAAAKRLQKEADECIVFEDAEAGIEAAIAAGMDNVGIGRPEILTKADLVVPGFIELNQLGFADKVF